MITIVFIIAIIAGMTYNKRTTTGYAILAVIVVIFFVIAYLTGDAPGSKAWDKLRSKK